MRALLWISAALIFALLSAGPAWASPAETIATPGHGAGLVENPVGAAVDQASGDLYVADRSNFRISKFDPSMPAGEKFRLAWGFGVADGTSAQLQTCGPESTPLHERCFGLNSSNTGAGNINPQVVAVDQSSHDVYVADPTRLRITKFTPSGEFLFMVGKGVDTGGGMPSNPGNICTAQYLANGDSCGSGGSGTGPNEFSTPRSLAVTPSGTVWVGDNGRLKSFSSSGTAGPEIVLAGAGNTQSLAFDSSEDFFVRSELLAGVRKLAGPGAGTPGELLCALDAAGQPRTVTVSGIDDVYVGDATSPYRFKVYDSGCPEEQTGQFGAGQVLGTPGSTSQGANAIAVGDTAGALYTASSLAENNSFVQSFALPAPGPLVEAQRAEGLLPTEATLAAKLSPEGQETEYRFEWGTSASYEHVEPAATLEESGSPYEGFEEKPVSVALEELTPDTEYHFHLVAESECEPVANPGHICVSEGPDATFTTRPAVSIDAQWASDVGARGASLHALLDPLGVEAEWWVEFGAGAAYGSETVKAHLPASFGDIAVGAALNGLAPATTYHYRFAARDVREGVPYVVHGADRTFTTQLAGLGFTLADSRAWEMVTPPNKHSGVLWRPGEGTLEAAADGGAVTYLSLNPIDAEPEGSRSPELASTLSRRAAGGAWSSRDLMAANPEYEHFTTGFGAEYLLFSSDLSGAVLAPRTPAPLAAEASERTPYLRQNTEPPAYTPLVTGKEGFANVPAGTEFGTGPFSGFSDVWVRGATADLGDVLLKSCVALKAGDAVGSLYEWVAGQAGEAQLRRVSVLPGGAAAVAGDPGFGKGSGTPRNAISADGSRVFWTTNSTSNCGTPTPGLYLRDAEREETVRLDSVQGGFGTGTAAPTFQGANAAGSVAFFTDTRNLTPDANESGRDLYRCDVTIEGGELKCTLTDLSADTATGTEVADVQGLALGVSDDGTRAYFVAKGVLAGNSVENGAGPEGATSGQPNLYLWQAGAGIRFIATLAGADGKDWAASGTQLSSQTAAASPSGRYLAFMSERPLSGYDNRDAASGELDQEVFRYDAEADGGEGGLICASCSPAGVRPAGLHGEKRTFVDPHELWLGRALAAVLPEAMLDELRGSTSFYRPRAVQDTGRLFFNAADALVPADSNGQWDVYEYEPTGAGSCSASSGGAATARSSGGCVSLISSGTGEEEAAFLDASESGGDAFFYTPARLAVTDEDEVMDVYDARVDGIAATRPPRAECLGEACQPAASAPGGQTPASAAFQGPGNLHAKPARRCPKGRREVRRKGKTHCVKRHHRKHRRHKRANHNRRAGR